MNGDVVHNLALKLTHWFAAILRAHPVSGASRMLRNLHYLVPERPHGQRVVRTVEGLLIEIDPYQHKGSERVIYTTGSYESGTLRLIGKLLPPGGTFIDAGANIGLMTVHAARQVGIDGRVIAFEPAPDSYATLCSNLQLNELDHVKVLQLALGRQQGRAKLRQPSHTNRGARTLQEVDTPTTGVNVAVAVLDEVLRTHDVKHVDLIKIDVEGWELEVLAGAHQMLSAADRPALIVESAGDVNAKNPEKLFDALAHRYGYRLFHALYGKEVYGPLQRVAAPQQMPRHDNVLALRPEHEDRLRDNGVELRERAHRQG